MPADTTPIPIAIPDSRAALARMYIDLTLAFHATTFPLNQSPTETDANLALVAVAVMLGHAEGRPMTATCVAAFSPHAALVGAGATQRADDERSDSAREGQILSHPGSRAAQWCQHRDTFELDTCNKPSPFSGRICPNRTIDFLEIENVSRTTRLPGISLLSLSQ